MTRLLSMLELEVNPVTPDFSRQSSIYEPGTGYKVCSWDQYKELRVEVGWNTAVFDVELSPEL
jgi:hypothetical protein